MAIGKIISRLVKPKPKPKPKVIPKKEVAKRLKARSKKKKSTKTEPLQKKFMTDAVSRYGVKRDVNKLKSKAAKMVQGAGDKSDPKVGKFGAGQKQARGGATPSAKEAMSSTEKDKLARQKAAAGSFKRAQGLKKGSIKQLEDAYDKLTADAKRAQRLKGTKSKYYPVFKKRGMKPMKKGGPLNSTRPKERPVDGIKTAAAPSCMKGLSQKEIDSILGKPSRDSEGVLRSDKKKKKKKKKVITAKEGRKVLKPVDQAKNPGLAKLPTKVRNNMGFAKKGGKVSYRKGGGQALVASLYD